MKTTTPEKLAAAYIALFPDEKPENIENLHTIFRNWLYRYEQDAGKTIAGANFAGKVTKALFLALQIRQPRTVRAMFEALK